MLLTAFLLSVGPVVQTCGAVETTLDLASNKLVRRITVTHVVPDRVPSTRAGAGTLEISKFLPSDLKTLRTVFCEAITASGTWTGSFSALQDLQSELMIEKEA